MKRQSRVVWSKGLFLTPQLFEAQERFLEGEVQFRSLLTGFERWGVDELNIDETALLNRKFRLTGCSGILDTGLAFSMHATDPLPEQRGFDSRSDGGQCSHSTYAARQVGHAVQLRPLSVDHLGCLQSRRKGLTLSEKSAPQKGQSASPNGASLWHEKLIKAGLGGARQER